MERLKVTDAISKRPESMVNLEHISVYELCENNITFSIVSAEKRMQKIRDEKTYQETGERPVYDIHIKSEDEQYHVFISTNNLVSRLDLMIKLMTDRKIPLDKMKDCFLLKVVKVQKSKGIMYDFEDV